MRDIFVKIVTGHTTVENAFVFRVHGDRIAGTDIGTVARVDRKPPSGTDRASAMALIRADQPIRVIVMAVLRS